jgi:hypothetical protein
MGLYERIGFGVWLREHPEWLDLQDWYRAEPYRWNTWRLMNWYRVTP